MKIIEEAEKWIEDWKQKGNCQCKVEGDKHFDALMTTLKYATYLDEKYELKPKNWQREAFGHLVEVRCEYDKAGCTNHKPKQSTNTPCEHKVHHKSCYEDGEYECGWKPTPEVAMPELPPEFEILKPEYSAQDSNFNKIAKTINQLIRYLSALREVNKKNQ